MYMYISLQLVCIIVLSLLLLFTSLSLHPHCVALQLWMGTHKKGPSVISHPPSLAGALLSDWLRDNQWALGNKVAKKFGGELPFLLKILSVNRALSIQAHPDKERAVELHGSAPDKYPDANHKPELVVVLHDFQGLCGFRPFLEVQAWVMKIPELQKVFTCICTLSHMCQ